MSLKSSRFSAVFSLYDFNLLLMEFLLDLYKLDLINSSLDLILESLSVEAVSGITGGLRKNYVVKYLAKEKV